jgi:hypothetical protein
MADLKVWFDQMFLLVRDEKNPVVLFPTGKGQSMPHQLFLFDAEPRTAIEVRGADLSFWVKDRAGNRTPFSNPKQKRRWPDPDRLLDFNTLAAPPDRFIKKTLYSRGETRQCPEALHARLYMPFGKFREEWNSREHGDARWLVGPKNDKDDQWLTDLMTFECKLEDDVTYELEVDVRGTPSYIPLQGQPGQDIEITFFNQDIPPPGFVPTAASVAKLSDFQVIYALAKGGSTFDVPEYYDAGIPIPRSVRRPKVYSNFRCVGANCPSVPSDPVIYPTSATNPEFPICGGGSGDPEP